MTAHESDPPPPYDPRPQGGIPPPPPRPNPPVSQRTPGCLAAIIGFPLAVFLFFLAALSSNPCGAFGDACDDYGKTPASFVWLALGSVVALVVGVCGLFAAFKSRGRR